MSDKIVSPKTPQQFTLEPGDNGRGDGPLHREPLVKNAPRQAGYGPGTYGNDQFAAELPADFDDRLDKPEGLDEPQSRPERPTHKPKEKRYGRHSGHGEGDD